MTLNMPGGVVKCGKFDKKLRGNIYGDKLCGVGHKRLDKGRDNF